MVENERFKTCDFTYKPNFQPEFQQKNKLSVLRKLRIFISGKKVFDKTSKCREFGAVMLMYARLLKQQSKISKTSDNKRANAS